MMLVYEIATGRITGVQYFADPPDAGFWPAGTAAVVASPGQVADTHYVVSGVATQRPALPLATDKAGIVADGVDKLTISGIPAATACRIADANGRTTVEVNDGLLEIISDYAQTIRVTFERFPYLTATIIVTAA